VSKLCTNYGPLVGSVGDITFHDFPTAEALTGADVESHLRTLGFGYRAKYIAQTARTVAGKPPGWLDSLRNPETPGFVSVSTADDVKKTSMTYKDAHRELLELSGVGPKVADCVCLMGLGWAEAVPIDTHVWQIAQRDYKYGKGKAKTFSTGMYESVGDFFRALWGKEAGWAHSVLFTADLKAFADRQVKTEAVQVSETKTEVDKGSATSRKRGRVDVVVKSEDGTKIEMLEIETNMKRRLRRFPSRLAK
jgi:N-glycosylase/DNA lyase